jgi:cytochrome P450
MVSFLIAGFETTATALSWFIYGMSKNPHAQQKLKAEVKGEDGRYDLSAERLDSLVYLDCVINEVFRYYAPTEFVTRTLLVDDRLPDSGTQLYNGEVVIIPTCIVGKDPELWSIDPERFYPERFLNEDKNHHPYAFLPFGSGHRQCVGQDLARFEFKVIVARLMQYVRFGDGGPELNAGGHVEGLTSKPKRIGVTIDFDRDE